MKTVLVCIVILLANCEIFSQNEYFIIPKKLKIALAYKLDSESFVDVYTTIKKTTIVNTYFLRLRYYSWGTIDTSLYREDKKNFYSTSLNSTSDYIEIPKQPIIGETWYNIDSSWVYTIKRIHAELITPADSYKDLVELEAKQTKQENKELYNSYLNYYCRGIGYVASIVNDKLICYLYSRNSQYKE